LFCIEFEIESRIRLLQFSARIGPESIVEFPIRIDPLFAYIEPQVQSRRSKRLFKNLTVKIFGPTSVHIKPTSRHQSDVWNFAVSMINMPEKLEAWKSMVVNIRNDDIGTRSTGR